MDDYIGLDVSMKETAVSIRRGGQRVWRGKCPSDPKLIADLILSATVRIQPGCPETSLPGRGQDDSA